MYEIISPKLRAARVSEAKPTGTSFEEAVELPSAVGKEELEMCAGDIPVCVQCGVQQGGGSRGVQQGVQQGLVWPP